VRAEVELREPETINFQVVGDFRESQPLFEGGVLVRTFADIECAEDAEFHQLNQSSPATAATRLSRGAGD
jgi:hypothetical protein